MEREECEAMSEGKEITWASRASVSAAQGADRRYCVWPDTAGRPKTAEVPGYRDRRRTDRGRGDESSTGRAPAWRTAAPRARTAASDR